MLINVKGQVDWNHHDLVLAESLVDKAGNFYNLTLQQAINEILEIDQEALEYCEYTVDLQKSFEACRLTQFTGWTKTKVIFINSGPFVHDSLLDWVPRNYT